MFLCCCSLSADIHVFRLQIFTNHHFHCIFSCLPSFHFLEILLILNQSLCCLTTCSLLQVYWCVSGSQPEAAVQHPAAPQDHQHVTVASRPQLPAGAALPPGLGLQQCHRLRARPPLHHRWEETSNTLYYSVWPRIISAKKIQIRRVIMHI